MKQILFLLTFGLIIGCKKEDAAVATKNNEFTINSKSFTLHHGILENWGDDGSGVFNNDITLISEELKVELADGIIENYAGTGNLLYLEAFSKSANSLPVGTYKFDDSMLANTFDLGYVGANANLETEAGDFYEIVDGTMKVLNISAKAIEVEVDLKTDDGKQLTGYFKGDLALYDYTKLANARIYGSFKKPIKKFRL